MSLIKCKECGKEISDTVDTCIHCGCIIEKETICPDCGNKVSNNENTCPKCGCPIKKEEKIITNINLLKNKKIFIPICLGIIVIVAILIILLTGGNKLYCVYETTNAAGKIKYEITYTFKDDRIKTIKGYHYAKPHDRNVAESLWSITNNNQDQYNYYEGMTYKATFSEEGEVKINYTLDADKAPTMFKAVVSFASVDGITASTTKNEVKTKLEASGYTCK